MWNIVLDWLANNYPLLLVCLVVFVLTWIIANFYYTRFKKTEDTVKKLPCDKHSEMFKQISDDLLQIKTYIMTRNPKAASTFSMKASPRKLNPAGESLYNDFGGEKFINTNKDFLLECIAQKRPKTALDVEIAANEILFENLQNDMFNELKSWVYNSPTRKLHINGEEKDYAVTINDVCFVISLPLRDLYLSNHPEIFI